MSVYTFKEIKTLKNNWNTIVTPKNINKTVLKS